MEEVVPIKRQYLVVYDYGTGGLWALLRARSEDEILRKHPNLTVIENRPEWMDDNKFAEIAASRSFDIDDEPLSDWLSSIDREAPLRR